MSQRSSRLTRDTFLTLHPRCCFCGGRRPAAERDHAPARIVFRGKHSPEDFEFPACGECNRAASLSEQVTAFYIRSIDNSYEQLDEDEYEKLISGIVNNAPDALPYRDPASQPEPYTQYIAPDAEDRTVSIPEIAKAHIELFGTKMLYAMYYRVTGNPASSTLRRLVGGRRRARPLRTSFDGTRTSGSISFAWVSGATSISAISFNIKPATIRHMVILVCTCRSAKRSFIFACWAPRRK